MRRLKATSMTLLLTLTLSSPGWTQSSPAPDLRRTKVEAGTKAPFSGILLTPAALAKLVTDLEKRAAVERVKREEAEAEAKARREAAGRICDARVEAERAKADAVRGELSAATAIYEKALSRSSASPPWYRSRYLAFITGAILSGGVCAGVAAVR